MHIQVLTLFPQMFASFLAASIVQRAIAKQALHVTLCDVRAFCPDPHRSADDYPFGGGAGMLLKPEPLAKALASLTEEGKAPGQVVYLSPAGQPLSQPLVAALAAQANLVLLCGHYEGTDQRVIDRFVDQQISLGDYVLSAGEVAAMVVIDAIARLLPGVLGSPASAMVESFVGGLLEYPQYTRPAEYAGLAVPEVLLQGNHAAIERWRQKEALRLTLRQRPELLLKAKLTRPQRELLRQVLAEERSI